MPSRSCFLCPERIGGVMEKTKRLEAMNHDKETDNIQELSYEYAQERRASIDYSTKFENRMIGFQDGVAYAREKHGAYPGNAENLDNVNKKERGLFEKYHVERVDGKPMPAGCIVLEWKDPNAWPGIAAFSRAVRLAGYLQLSDDLDKRLEAMGYCAGEKQGEEIAKLKTKIKKAKERILIITGFCEHIDDLNGELCDCSTQMSIDAKQALKELEE